MMCIQQNVAVSSMMLNWSIAYIKHPLPVSYILLADLEQDLKCKGKFKGTKMNSVIVNDYQKRKATAV